MLKSSNKILLLVLLAIGNINISFASPKKQKNENNKKFSVAPKSNYVDALIEDDNDDEIPEVQEDIPTIEITQEPVVKPPIKFSVGDLDVTFGGRIRIEYDKYMNPIYLNKVTPDNFDFFKQTIDLTLDLVFGEKKCGYKAFEAYFDLRSKGKWGVVGAYKNTTLTEVKLGDISLGEHDHRASRANPWFKDAWMQVSLNKIVNSDCDKIQFLKLGLFPFQLGRGVAFGPFYATVYENLGLFSYNADASAPGININGELVKNKLWYDLYYAKFEDNSSAVSDTLNTVRQNQVGRRSTPYRGTSKDDELWAARLKIKPFDDRKSGKLYMEPYVYFNEASDQKVEVPNDAKTQLGAYGIELKYHKNKFKIGGEVAFNYGQEKLYSIDRNKTQLSVLRSSGQIPQTVENVIDNHNDQYGAGLLYKGYSHVVVNSAGDLNNSSAPMNTASTAAAYNTNYILRDNSTPYPDGGINDQRLKNLSTRIRPEYKNDFVGWMGIIDGRYKFTKDFKMSFELGYASGDNDPHIQEVNKKYHGFVGLHELYMGKRVFSPLLLGERYVARPLGLIPGQRETDGFRAKTNNTFSDLEYVGIGATWKPDQLRKNRFKVNPNLLFFWKSDDSYKYDFDPDNYDNSQVSSTEKASSFMGAEINVIFNYELLKDLTLSGILSLFAPGSYYQDIKGVPLQGDFYRDKIPSDARTGVNPLYYRLSDNCSFYGVISLEYRF